MTHPGTSRIYEVRRESPNGRVHTFGARRTRAEAEVLLAESVERVEAAGGYNERYWIEEIDTTGLWQPPAQPKPRDRYSTRVTTTSPPGTWKKVHVDVLDGEIVIASYDRNLKLATDPKLAPRDFIRCSSWQGERRVEFCIERGFT